MTPDECFTHGNIDSGSEFYIVIFIVVFVLVIFLFLMIFRYKKIVQKEMEDEMNL
jgi:preprotein translocase subunit YajC